MCLKLFNTHTKTDFANSHKMTSTNLIIWNIDYKNKILNCL